MWHGQSDYMTKYFVPVKNQRATIAPGFSTGGATIAPKNFPIWGNCGTSYSSSLLAISYWRFDGLKALPNTLGTHFVAANGKGGICHTETPCFCERCVVGDYCAQSYMKQWSFGGKSVNAVDDSDEKDDEEKSDDDEWESDGDEEESDGEEEEGDGEEEEGDGEEEEGDGKEEEGDGEEEEGDGEEEEGDGEEEEGGDDDDDAPLVDPPDHDYAVGKLVAAKYRDDKWYAAIIHKLREDKNQVDLTFCGKWLDEAKHQLPLKYIIPDTDPMYWAETEEKLPLACLLTCLQEPEIVKLSSTRKIRQICAEDLRKVRGCWPARSTRSKCSTRRRCRLRRRRRQKTLNSKRLLLRVSKVIWRHWKMVAWRSPSGF